MRLVVGNAKGSALPVLGARSEINRLRRGRISPRRFRPSANSESASGITGEAKP